MKKLAIILIIIFFPTNILADEKDPLDGLTFIEVEEKTFVEKILDKFTGPKKLTKAKTDIFSLTCEGEIIRKAYEYGNLFDTKKEIFFEDFEIYIETHKKKKRILEINMTNSSHHHLRDTWYYDYEVTNYKKNLRISNDQMQLSLLSLNREYNFPDDDGKMKYDESPARISLKSGVYSGKFKGEIGDQWIMRYDFRSKCAGAAEIVRYIKSEKKNYLDYWWAVILIIAITFFIFTQSGKRLKKIRRK